jgi:hypothetical protein
MSTTKFVQDALTDEVSSKDQNDVTRLEPGTVQVTHAGQDDEIVYRLLNDEQAQLVEGSYDTAEKVFKGTGYRVESGQRGGTYIEEEI